MVSDNEIKKWFVGMPFVTRWHLAISGVLSILATLGILNGRWLCLPATWWECLQLWRYPTACLFHGPFSFGLLLHGYFSVQASTQIEKLMFAQDPYKFLWVLLASFAMLLPFCMVLGIWLPSECVTPLLVFIACRSQPTAVMQFLFAIKVQALYFPLVLLAFRFLSGGSLLASCLGMFVGHLYVYHEVIKAKERAPDVYLPLQGFYTAPKWLQNVEKLHRKKLLGSGALPASWAN